MRLARAGFALAACAACRGRAPAPPVATPFVEPPPPARPAALRAVAHLGQPRVTLDTLAEAGGARRPADLVLVAALGVDVAVVAAVDTARPIDVALLGGAQGGYAFAMTPASASQARSLLASRYRFATVEGFGERLTLRGDPGLSSTERRVPCALVRVPSAVASRVVCGSDEAALLAAGRWVAYESAARAGSRADFEAVVEGDGVAREAGDALRALAAQGQRRLLADASAARRAHDRPPDYGDPEALVRELGALLGELTDSAGAVRRAAVRADVSRAEVAVTVELTLPDDGASALSRDARGRSEAPVDHPLAAMLPADAVLVLGDRAPAAQRADTLRRVAASALRVLGDRVTLPAAARADLDALVAHAGDGLAAAASRDAPDGVEVSLALSQTDGGAGARAALARMATAPWLRALRVGAPPVVTALREGIVVARPAAPGAAPTPSLALGVRAGALVMVLGRHAASTLDAAAVRAGLPPPALLGDLRASVAGAVDLEALGVRDAAPARFSYGARRASGAVTATLRVTLPPQAMALALP
jgi:hypothetical protein